jgi:AcrR family transcriptional regulator
MDTSAEQAGFDPLGSPRDIVADHQRQRILAATIDLVAKRGYRGTSIDHILRSARVGYTAFDGLFADKEECFCAAFDRVVGDARARIAIAVPPSAPWPEQVCAALHSLLELIAAEPFRARLVLAESHTAGELALQRYQSLLDEAALLLREGRALRSADAPELPPTLEEASVSGISWLLNQRVVLTELEGVEELFAELALIVLEPYLGNAAAHALITAHAGARAPA